MDYNTIFLIILWALRLTCVSFLIISWKNLRWSIFFICAFLPTYLIRFKGPFDVPMTMLELMILILFVIWFIKKGWKNLNINFQKNKLLIIGAGLFLLSATISIFISPDIRAAAGIWKAYFIEPILFLIVFLSVIKKEDLKFVVMALGFSAFYISFYAIGQKFFNLPIPVPWQEETRATGIFPFPNAVGLFLAPIIPLLFWQLISNFKFQTSNFFIKIFYFIAIISSSAAIYFAKSEGALVALVIGAIFWGLIQNKISRKITILIILLGITSCVMFLNTPTFSKIKTKLFLEDWSGKVRLTIWSETWEMIKDKPLFGAGLAGYQTAIIPHHKSSKWMEVFLYPHNILFNFWSETGLLGLISFVLIITYFYKTARKYPAVAASMTILLIHGLVDVPYFKNDLAVLFWIIVSFSLVPRKNELTN